MAELINDRVLERDYAVGNGPGPVLLSVTIGDGQIGGSAVWLDSTQVAKGDITAFSVGEPSAVKGQRLGVQTVVADVNEMTNKASVTYAITGGSEPAEYTLWFEAPQDKMGIPFTAIFTLV